MTDKVDFPEVIEKEIRAISASIRKLRESRLSERAIIVLIHDALPSATYGHPRIGKPAIKQVLDAAENLELHYLKKAKIVALANKQGLPR